MTQLTVSDIFDLFEAHGSSHYGEAVCQTAHALQSARQAEIDDASPELVIAALLHDLGHLFAPESPSMFETDDHHEAIGAERLMPVFGPAVAHPIALHVAAKRYLCAVDPNYWAGLSPTSKQSLMLQGGPFDDAQRTRFETLPYWRDAVALRRYDDSAKTLGAPTSGLSDYRALMERLAAPTT